MLQYGAIFVFNTNSEFNILNPSINYQDGVLSDSVLNSPHSSFRQDLSEYSHDIPMSKNVVKNSKYITGRPPRPTGDFNSVIIQKSSATPSLLKNKRKPKLKGQDVVNENKQVNTDASKNRSSSLNSTISSTSVKQTNSLKSLSGTKKLKKNKAS